MGYIRLRRVAKATSFHSDAVRSSRSDIHLRAPPVHPRHSQTRIFDAFRCFAAPFAHEAALPSWNPAGRFSCKHESACWVPRVNWDNKKRLLSSNRRPCHYRFIPSQLNTEILFCIFYIHSQPVRISPRPISICQLHALLHFHLKPIYLILSKGSYLLG